jgi:hypothetical protein
MLCLSYYCLFLLFNCYVFFIIAYFYSSMELEKSAEQVLPGREGGSGEMGGGREGEMTQTV